MGKRAIQRSLLPPFGYMYCISNCTTLPWKHMSQIRFDDFFKGSLVDYFRNSFPDQFLLLYSPMLIGRPDLRSRSDSYGLPLLPSPPFRPLTSRIAAI
jgi:hypothetical protein